MHAEEKIRVMQAIKIRELELLLQITEEICDMPEVVVLPDDVILNVV